MPVSSQMCIRDRQLLEPHGFERLLKGLELALEVGQHRVIVLLDGQDVYKRQREYAERIWEVQV